MKEIRSTFRSKKKFKKLKIIKLKLKTTTKIEMMYKFNNH